MAVEDRAEPTPIPPQRTHEGIESVMLVTPVWGRSGGVATHVKASAAALAERGVEVHVLAARVHSHEQIANVTVHHQEELLDAPASVRIDECVSTRPSVYHFHQVDDLRLTELLQGSAPVVASVHGYPGCTSGVHYFAPGQECERAHGPGCIPNLIARGCAHTRHPKTLPRKYANATRGLRALARADLTISYSATIDRHLAANGLGRRALVALFPTMTPPRESIAAVERRVVYAGRVEAQKGVGVLLRAVRETDCELVICGEGRQLAPMRALAARMEVEGRVRFAGWLEPDELAREVAAASVVAVPSLWPEPFGLVGIEALALERPVVASVTGGVRDWLTDEVGIGVKPGDVGELARALGQLLGDRERRQALGAAGRRLVAERFSPERHVQTLLAAYGDARAGWQAQRAGAPRARRAPVMQGAR